MPPSSPVMSLLGGGHDIVPQRLTVSATALYFVGVSACSTAPGVSFHRRPLFASFSLGRLRLPSDSPQSAVLQFSSLNSMPIYWASMFVQCSTSSAPCGLRLLTSWPRAFYAVSGSTTYQSPRLSSSSPGRKQLLLFSSVSVLSTALLLLAPPVLPFYRGTLLPSVSRASHLFAFSRCDALHLLFAAPHHSSFIGSL